MNNLLCKNKIESKKLKEKKVSGIGKIIAEKAY